MITYRFCIYGLLLLSPVTQLSANPPQTDTASLCPVDASQTLTFNPPPVFPEDEIDNINISAEKVQNLDNNVTAFSGNVLIEKHLLRLTADEVTHNRETQQLDLKGHIQADTEGMTLSSESGSLNLDTNQGELLNNHYYIRDSQLNGSTPRFSISDEKTTTLVDTSFSTCPPQKMDWHLDTAWLELDQENATGTAKHTVLWVKDVPVFYLPWIQFPLGDERRSGFLMPGFGSSSDSGFEFSLPWYWNIAPNQDATLTPRYLRKRGNMLQTEYRFLTRKSRGELNVDYLENDRLLDQERYLLHLNNQNQITRDLQLQLLADDVSDSDYLRDLGSNINIANTTHLQRTARLSYAHNNWRAGLMAQSYETLDQLILLDDRPYRRLPQVTLAGHETLFSMGQQPLVLSLDSEWVEFEHESLNREQGSRFHAYPRLSLPMQGNAWFLTPAIGVMHTQYELTDSNDQPLDIEDRSLTVTSLDSGLIFERRLADDKLIQTLEPRLFLLDIPYEDQSAIPLFDTSERDFSFASLFRENRFNGIDRIGDTRQATLALSTRLLDPENGDELMSASVGRIFYDEDRRVSLDNTVTTSNASDIVGELSGRFGLWKARTTVQWDTETEKSDKSSLQLNYSSPENAVFNLGYRFHRDPVDELNNLEQVSTSFVWPFASQYSLLGRWNYSITDERDIDTLTGIEYESCCWALRLIAQRYLTDNIDQPYDTSVMFQFVLKGFGSIADRAATDTLKHAILGYQPDF